MGLYEAVLDVAAKELILDGSVYVCKSDNKMPSVFRVTIPEAVTIPPNSEMILSGTICGQPNFVTGVFEMSPSLCESKPLLVAKMVAYTNVGQVPLRIMNPTGEPQVLYKGQVAAICEPAKLISEVPPSVLDESECSGVSAELPTHLRSMLDSCRENVTPEQLEQIRQLLWKYQEAFAVDEEDLGEAVLELHRINTGDALPIKQQPRRLPLAKRLAAREEVDKMMAQGVIEKSLSPWASPIVLVPKKTSGKYRFCLDYRALNAVTRKDSYPLPRIDASLEALQGSSWFTTVDLQSGYHQMLLHPDDREKTAFVTPDGLYQFRRLAMGLVNGVAGFSRLMDRVLAGLSHEVVLPYIDDLIVGGTCFEVHLHNLELVLERLVQANLKISPQKCQLFQKVVHFLGHVVSAQGLQPEQSKIEAVVNWPVPRTATQVRSFLGLASYYRKFVKGFANIARPLHTLTEKGVAFDFSEDCQKAFDTLKAALTASPIIGYPLDDHDFILDCDASGQALGAVLSQLQDGKEVVLAYYSKVFSPAERNYCTTRRELLALVSSVKQYHHFLYGRVTTIRTDHGALKWLMRFKNPEGQVARWLEALSMYDFTIVHRPGAQHLNADALSRRPCEDCRYCTRQEEKEQQVALQGASLHPLCAGIKTQDPPAQAGWLPEYSQKELKDQQAQDIHLKTVLQWLEADSRPNWAVIKCEGATIRIYWSMWKQLKIVDGLVYKLDPTQTVETDRLRLIAPKQVRDEILTHLHNHKTAAHLGITKTLNKVRARFWWPGLKPDVMRWCKQCVACQKRNMRVGRKMAPLQQDQVGSPMEKLGMDILSFREVTDDGNCCVLVVVDYFTKWTEAIAMPDHTALTVADCLVTEVFTRFGCPRIIITDQGREFEGNLMTALYRLLEITKVRTSPYHPRSDALAENFNRTLINMLAKFCQTNKSNWDHHLPFLLCAYRSSIHESTQCSPNLLMLGREMRLPVDVMYSVSDPVAGAPQCPMTYVEWLRQAFEENFETVRESLKAAALRQKSYFDRRTKMRSFQKGDWVLRFYPPAVIQSKLNSPYIGPFLVIEVMGEVNYMIQEAPEARTLVVHVDDLKGFIDTSGRRKWVENPISAPPPQTEEVPREKDSPISQGTVPNEESLPDNTAETSVSAGDRITKTSESTESAVASTSREPPSNFQPMKRIPVPETPRTIDDCLPKSKEPLNRPTRARRLPNRFKDFVV